VISANQYVAGASGSVYTSGPGQTGATANCAATTASTQDPSQRLGQLFILGNCTCWCQIILPTSTASDFIDFSLSKCQCNADCASSWQQTNNPTFNNVDKRDDPPLSDHKADEQAKRQYTQVPFNERPYMLVANSMAFGNSCYTPHTDWEVKYPNPGPDVVPSDGSYPLMLPMGNCTGPWGPEDSPGWQHN